MKEYNFNINGNEYSVLINSVEDNVASVTVNGAEYSVEVGGMTTKPKAPKLVQATVVPSTDSHPSVAKTSSPAQTVAAAGSIKSPLPGVILSVAVNVGDSIKVGQRILVLEAMKMENNIDSDKEGIVKSVNVNKGDSVLEGDVLITIA